MAEPLDGVMQAVNAGGDEPIDASVRGDVVDSERLGDLVGRDGEEIVAFLRESRVPRLRPVLVALASRAAGGSAVDPELQYAAELLHLALSVHDVALGPHNNRRHTLARTLLRGVGWIGSNRLLLRAMDLARHASTPGAIDELLDTLSAFHEGQVVSERMQAVGPPDLGAWSDHANGHTGALLSFCCRVGGRVGGSGAGDVAALGRYGRHVGRLWHIAEDVVLLQGPDAVEQLVGRALVGRPMLPVAVALDRRPEAASLWHEVVRDHDADAATRLLAVLRDTRAVAGTREIAAREHWSARQEVARFEETTYRRSLERLASGLARAPYDDVVPGFTRS